MTIFVLVGTMILSALYPSVPASSDTAELAAPEIMILHGDILPRRIVIANWHDNHQILLATTEVPPPTLGRLRDRRSISVAMFWGTRWRTVARDSAALAALSPASATQHAQFFPAQGEVPAFLVLSPSARGARVRRVEADALAILARHGVPHAFGQ